MFVGFFSWQTADPGPGMEVVLQIKKIKVGPLVPKHIVHMSMQGKKKTVKVSICLVFQDLRGKTFGMYNMLAATDYIKRSCERCISSHSRTVCASVHELCTSLYTLLC